MSFRNKLEKFASSTIVVAWYALADSTNGGVGWDSFDILKTEVGFPGTERPYSTRGVSRQNLLRTEGLPSAAKWPPTVLATDVAMALQWRAVAVKAAPTAEAVALLTLASIV